MGKTERQESGLRARVEKERAEARGSRVRYSARLRADVVRYAKRNGLSASQVARRLSLSDTGVQKWLNKGEVAEPRLGRVDVVVEDSKRERSGLTLEFPNGARVVGLSVEDVALLLGSRA